MRNFLIQLCSSLRRMPRSICGQSGSSPSRSFLLETLEARLLLSAAPLEATVADASIGSTAELRVSHEIPASPSGGATQLSLDIDDDGQTLAAFDGKLILHALAGTLAGQLGNGTLLSPTAHRTSGADITHFFDYLRSAAPSPMDADGDGALSPFSDGRLIYRYLFGVSGSELVQGIRFGPSAVRRDAAAIAAFLSQFDPEANTTPPIIAARLAHDNGASTTDGLTNDATITGTVMDFGRITSFRGSFGAVPATNGSDLLPFLSANGSFTLTPQTMGGLAGAAELPDGAHVLHLQATGPGGLTGALDVAFVLDRVSPSLEVDWVTPNLATGPSQSIVSGDVTRTVLDAQAIPSVTLLTAAAVPQVGGLTDVDVTLSVTHARTSDLSITLISPAGTRVPLIASVSGQNFTGTILSDQAAGEFALGQAPYTGEFRPVTPLSQLNGQSAGGSWSLEIVDNQPSQGGQAQAWSLTLITDGEGGPTQIVSWTGGAGQIADASVSASTSIFELPVQGVVGVLGDLDVEINLTHSRFSDVELMLTSPNGTSVRLVRNPILPGTGPFALSGTRFSDEAVIGLEQGTAPYTGLFRPVVDASNSRGLAAFDGQDPNGVWTLRFVDSVLGESGVLTGWRLILEPTDGETFFRTTASTVSVRGTGQVGLQTVLTPDSVPPAGISHSVLSPDAQAPTVLMTSPRYGAVLPNGPVEIQFQTANHPLGDLGQTHLRLYLDNDPTPYVFLNGSTQEVHYQGIHTHFIHWKSANSVEIFGLASGTHQVRVVLADAAGVELVGPLATHAICFSVAAPVGGELTLQSMLTGLSHPVAMALAPDGRVFFNEFLTGRVRIIDPGWNLRTQAFYTVSNLRTGGEQGLLGLAFDPDFSTNGFVYLYYTANNPTRNRVIRVTEVNGQGTDETVILDDLPASVNHNGGTVHFGPDGKLYVTIGDAEVASFAQDSTRLNGKILRLNKDGSIPSDNPTPGSAVYASGLRNSFDFAFHPHTGDLWATENGPQANDEINRIVAGGNYGWPLVGGAANDPRFIDPLVSLTPTISPTGIVAIPEGSPYPEQFHDNLLFADFNGGRLRRIVLSGPDSDQLGDLSIAYGGGSGSLVDLIVGPDGYIYANNLIFGGSSGIYRVVLNEAAGPPQPSGTVAADGTFTINNVTPVLGVNPYTVTSIDAAGNASSVDFTVTRLATTQDAATPVLSASVTDLSGTPDDGVTATARVTGTLADQNPIETFLAGFDDVPLDQYVNVLPDRQSDGSFSFETGRLAQILGRPLTDGAYVLHLRAVDLVGNPAATLSIPFTLDRRGPALLVAAPAEGAILLPTLRLTGSVSDPTTISLHYRFDQGPPIPVPVATGSGTFDVLMDQTGLTSPTHLLTVTAVDQAGNQSVVTRMLVRDTLPPLLTASLTDQDGVPGDGIVLAPHIAGTVTDSSPLAGFRAGFNVTPPAQFVDVLSHIGPNGAFIFDAAELAEIFGQPFADGAYTFHLEARDAAGNPASTVSVSFTLDNAAPQLTVTSPIEGAVLAVDAPFTGIVTDLTAVMLQYRFGAGPLKEVMPEPLTGSFSVLLDQTGLVPGLTTLTITATDRVGKRTVIMRTVEIPSALSSSTVAFEGSSGGNPSLQAVPLGASLLLPILNQPQGQENDDPLSCRNPLWVGDFVGEGLGLSGESTILP